MNCRFCNTKVEHVFVDLYNSPPSNSFLNAHELNEPEVFYPLKVMVCENCFLVQVDEFKKSDAIFNSEYVYFSSFSKSWLQHAEKYTKKMIDNFQINEQSLVVELASNDGYLLQYFNKAGVPVLGVEPTLNTAEVARSLGIETVVDFFGERLASDLKSKGKEADLLLGNNVLAHVPDIRDFVGGMKILLKPEGIITMEFPHLLQLVMHNQFDTIYHEHFSYLSFNVVKKIFESKGLRMFDVEELTTHGGSLRIYACHQNSARKETSNVQAMLDKEDNARMNTLSYYEGFQDKVLNVKLEFLQFLLTQKNAGKVVAGYGAAAKGNTLMNYCGVKSDLISFVCDKNPNKQNKFLPASHIMVYGEEKIKTDKPDYIVLFPWNLEQELVDQLGYIREWGGKFVVPIPTVKIID